MDIEKLFAADKPKCCDHLRQMLDISLSEEHKAVADYEMRAHKCGEYDDQVMAEFFQELANDEKAHVAQIQRAYELLGFVDADAQDKGEAEAEEILGEAPAEAEVVAVELDPEVAAIIEA